MIEYIKSFSIIQIILILLQLSMLITSIVFGIKNIILGIKLSKMKKSMGSIDEINAINKKIKKYAGFILNTIFLFFVFQIGYGINKAHNTNLNK